MKHRPRSRRQAFHLTRSQEILANSSAGPGRASEEKHRAILETKQAPWRCWIPDRQGATPRVWFFFFSLLAQTRKLRTLGEVGDRPERDSKSRGRLSKPENVHPAPTPELAPSKDRGGDVHPAPTPERVRERGHLASHASSEGGYGSVVSPTLRGPGCKARLPSEGGQCVKTPLPRCAGTDPPKQGCA